MLVGNDVHNIKLLYTLLARDPDHPENLRLLAVSFKECIISIARETIKDETEKKDTEESIQFDMIKFVEDIFSYIGRIENIVAESFENNFLFQSQKDEAITFFLKKYENFPRHLACYMDYQLTDGDTIYLLLLNISSKAPIVKIKMKLKN